MSHLTSPWRGQQQSSHREGTVPPPPPPEVVSKAQEEIEAIGRELGLHEGGAAEGKHGGDADDDPDFWLRLPRTFSAQSSRFELPVDAGALKDLTPIAYLSRYVAVGSSRRMLYDRVFTRHRSLKDGQLNDEVST